MPPITVQTNPADAYSADLQASLGYFWTRMYADRNFVSNLCKGDSLIAAQCYLEFLETVACLNRSAVPVYHRVRWFPLVIRESERNTGAGVSLYLGIKPVAVLGPQPASTAYTPDTEFNLGGPALKHGFTSYPAHSDQFDAGMRTVCSAIISPKATYLSNVDYYLTESGIVFKSELDPFMQPDKFNIRTISGTAGIQDREIVLWGSDTLVDYNYVPDFFGYLQKPVYPDPVYGAEATDAVLELRAAGPSLALLRKNLGRLFATPVVKSDNETVQDIYVNSDNYTYVITNANVYKCSPSETLVAGLARGSVLDMGDFVTNTLRFYAKLNPDTFYPATGYTLSQFIADVPKLAIPKGLVSPEGLGSGLAVDWTDTDILCSGLDINKHPLLSFSVGSPETSAAYWTAVWKRCAETGGDLSMLLAEFLNGQPFIAGNIVGSINPMRFFMKNCLNSNTSVLVVDFDAIPEYIRSLDLLYELNRATAAHALLIMVARTRLAEDPYDLAPLRESLDAYVDLGGMSYVHGQEELRPGNIYRPRYVPKYVGKRLHEASGTGSLTYMDFKPKIRRVPR